jgi:hypothetical protein
MGPRLSMLIGLLFGYIEAYGYMDRIELSMNTAASWEGKSLVKRFSGQTGKFLIF